MVGLLTSDKSKPRSSGSSAMGYDPEWVEWMEERLGGMDLDFFVAQGLLVMDMEEVWVDVVV